MRNSYRDDTGKIIFAWFILTLVVLWIGAEVSDSLQVNTVKECKVLDLQQQLIRKTSTEIRYLIVTDKETFVCESSMFNGKFNNSDVFWRLKKDSTYNFKVAGYGKGWFFNYRNVLEVVK